MKIRIIILCLIFQTTTIAQNDTTKNVSNIQENKILQEESDENFSKIEIVNKSLDKIAKKLLEKKENNINWNTFWNTLIPVLVGSFLTLIVQSILEKSRNKKEEEQRKRELISEGQAKIYLIAQILKDLAMYKVHKQYYIKAHKINGSEDSFKKHYEKGQEQRKTEMKLDEKIAGYFKLVSEYDSLTNSEDITPKQLKKIFEYQHPVATKFEKCETLDDLVEELKQDEKRLNKEYERFFDIFQDIQSKMK